VRYIRRGGEGGGGGRYLQRRSFRPVTVPGEDLHRAHRDWGLLIFLALAPGRSRAKSGAKPGAEFAAAHPRCCSGCQAPSLALRGNR